MPFKNLWIIFYLAFITLFIVFFGYANGYQNHTFYFDSGYYYDLSQSFMNNGFSFTNYPLNYRGYFFPFLLFCFVNIGNIFHFSPNISLMIGAGITVAFAFVAFAELFQALISAGPFIPFFIFFTFWRDLIYYPLSDFYAFSFLVFAIYWLSKIRKTIRLINFILFSLLSGICFYAAYNIRTIYLACAPILLILWFKEILRSKSSFSWKFISAISSLSGVLISAIPQLMINNKYYNNFNAFVPTQGLNGFQMYSGLYMQRYETFVGNSALFPSPGVIFYDKVGKTLIEMYSLTPESSVFSFFTTIFKHPFDYLGILTHIWSMA